MSEYERNSEKFIEYVENRILEGTLKVGDSLPAERVLAQQLGISRTAVREGIRILEVIGIVESRHGSGNYIQSYFDKTLVQVLTMMYALDGLSYNEIREFRYSVERQALVLAVNNADEESRTELTRYLQIMEDPDRSEQEQTQADHMIHYTIIQMSGNRLVIANYLALNRIIGEFIGDIRRQIRKESLEDFAGFQSVHRQMVEAICTGDLDLAKDALDRHFVYISQDIDT